MKYKLLGRSGLRVSELCLGTMTFGTEWGWGADKTESQKIFDTYAGLGGNFIDTANRYTEGTSERFLGEFVKSDRDHFVVATKYTLRDQVEYSLLQRSPERELLPMAKAFGMAVTPWGAIAGGALTGKYLRGEAGRIVEHSARRSDRANEIASKVVNIAEKLNVPPAQVAINWARQRDPALNCIPLIGARTAAQIAETMGCMDLVLPENFLRELDTVSDIQLGFPHEFLQSENVRELVYEGKYADISR